MNQDTDQTWAAITARLTAAENSAAIELWLQRLVPVELDGSRLILGAPSSSRRWIAERFGPALTAAARAVLSPDAGVEIVDADRAAKGDAHGASCRTAPPVNHRRTFEQFVIGDCNRLAHAAALTVAEMPATAYNPLFIYGPPGVGKTHLLQSIAALAARHSPDLRIRLTSGEEFTNAFLEALAERSTERFKREYRDVDVLLVDDVQFLERKTRTEEEFFHTFNALHDAGSQIVVSSDRPPRDLQAVEQRLRERFQAGLVADIAPPDLATRLTILRKRAASDGIPVPDERALARLAARVTTDVRALEGALIRTVAYASLGGRPLTVELVDEVLDRLYGPQTGGTPTVERIQEVICERFGITRDELIAGGRAKRYLWPRQVAMYLSRELTGESLPEIARSFGGRDHTTVLAAWRRTGERISTDRSSSAVVESLRTTLEP
jgi:chromosomal replication initiator protein